MITESEIENSALEQFRCQNPDLFQKNDWLLFQHLGTVIFLLSISTAIVVISSSLQVKIILGILNAFFLFSLINTTIHHHHTHHNAANGLFARKFLDLLYFIAVPNAPKRLVRYTRAHLNHHARPFHETDVDHHYGKDRYLKMVKNFGTRVLYFLELTFVGGHVPGWEDDRYMNQVPLETWNQKDYFEVKQKEQKTALRASLIQWGLFGVFLMVLPRFAWGWIFPMLLVKNWSHFLGQFQHYDNQFLDPARSALNRTKTYRIPSWVNYLAGGEISGHFLHHLFPEMPYYNVEWATERLLRNPELAKFFVTY